MTKEHVPLMLKKEEEEGEDEPLSVFFEVFVVELSQVARLNRIGEHICFITRTKWYQYTTIVRYGLVEYISWIGPCVLTTTFLFKGIGGASAPT